MICRNRFTFLLIQTRKLSEALSLSRPSYETQTTTEGLFKPSSHSARLPFPIRAYSSPTYYAKSLRIVACHSYCLPFRSLQAKLEGPVAYCKPAA